MNANKARELSQIGGKTADDYEAGGMSLQEYHDKIVYQSRHGQYVMVERGKIKDKTKELLESEGYTVKCRWDGDSGMYWTRVSWEPEDHSGKKLTKYMGIAIGALLLLCIGLLTFKYLNQ
jgi:hypothetical protein